MRLLYLSVGDSDLRCEDMLMMEDNRPDWLDAGRIPSVDGLRAIAVALVLLDHAHRTQGFPAVTVLHTLGPVSHIGVEIFFILSGFLITTLMIREIGRSGRLDLKAFYRRRFLRIVPAYVALIMVVAALQFAGHAALQRRDWLAAATYTMNFLYHPAWELGHAWSLAIEEHFYLLWPPVVALVPSRCRAGLLAGCLAACCAGRWIVLLALPGWSPMAELWTFTRLDSIAAGCLLAVLMQESAWRVRFDRAASWWAITLAVLLFSLGLSKLSAKWSVGVAYTLNDACLALLVWAAVRRAPRWLSCSAITVVGIGSYSLYLWQQLFLNPHRPGWATTFPQNLVLAALAAWASYRMVEAPFLRLKDKPSARPHSRAMVSDVQGAVPPGASPDARPCRLRGATELEPESTVCALD